MEYRHALPFCLFVAMSGIGACNKKTAPTYGPKAAENKPPVALLAPKGPIHPTKACASNSDCVVVALSCDDVAAVNRDHEEEMKTQALTSADSCAAPLFSETRHATCNEGACVAWAEETVCRSSSDCVLVDVGCELVAPVKRSHEDVVAKQLKGLLATRTCAADARTPAYRLTCEKNACTAKPADSSFADGCAVDADCATTAGICGPDIGVVKSRLKEAEAHVREAMSTIDCDMGDDWGATAARCVNQWCVAQFD